MDQASPFVKDVLAVTLLIVHVKERSVQAEHHSSLLTAQPIAKLSQKGMVMRKMHALQDVISACVVLQAQLLVLY